MKSKPLLCPAPGLLYDLQGRQPRPLILQGRPGSLNRIEGNLGKKSLLLIFHLRFNIFCAI